jgi:hypothetical protein
MSVYLLANFVNLLFVNFLEFGRVPGQWAVYLQRAGKYQRPAW